MAIRRAGSSDVDTLAKLNAHVQDLHAAAEPSLYRPSDLQAIRAWMEDRLAREGTEAWIYLDGGEPLGYVVFKIEHREEHAYAHERTFLCVDQLGVVPRARRRGIGRALMATVDERARVHGVTQIELSVRAFNGDALAFYRALGYRETLLRLTRDL